MALRIIYHNPTGATLAASVRRQSDEALYDFQDGAFRTNPTSPTTPLLEGTGIFAGQYRASITATPTNVWQDGDYLVTIHESGQAVDGLPVIMLRGDDSSRPDPWANAVATSYPDGSFGKLLAQWDRLGVPLTVQGAGATTEHFTVSATTPAAGVDAFVGQVVVFLSGQLVGLRRTVKAYDSVTRLLTVDTPFPTAPVNSDRLQVY